MKNRIFFITLFLIVALLTSCGNGDIGAQEETEAKKLSGEDLYENVSPSVVTITAESSNFTSSGTGFFYTKDIIVTNYHVIEGCSSATITLSNGQVYKVLSVIGYDQAKDIALLKTQYDDGKPIAKRKGKIKTGEKVYAIGNSLGFLEGSLSEGIVSSAQRELNGNVYIQTTAPVTHGNSGGPLLDEYGKVIGIVSAGFGDGLDLNLAIPIDEIKAIDTSDPLTMYEFSIATTPYNVLLNFIKQNGSKNDLGYTTSSFWDNTGAVTLTITYTKFDFISITYKVDENFSFDVRIYPNKSTCNIGATLRDKSLHEVVDTAVRGYSQEIDKTKVFDLYPARDFEFVFWDGYDETYYSIWSNYYNTYLDDLFEVYDYYITRVAGLSCDSQALGFTVKR